MCNIYVSACVQACGTHSRCVCVCVCGIFIRYPVKCVRRLCAPLHGFVLTIVLLFFCLKTLERLAKLENIQFCIRRRIGNDHVLKVSCCTSYTRISHIVRACEISTKMPCCNAITYTHRLSHTDSVVPRSFATFTQTLASPPCSLRTIYTHLFRASSSTIQQSSSSAQS